MFLALSKVLDLALTPLAWVLALLLLAGLLRNRGRTPLVLGALAFSLLYLSSIGAVEVRLARFVERGAVTTFRPDASYDAAVVLCGMVDAGASRASGEVELTDAADRVVRAFELFRAGRVRTIVVSGGDVWPVPGSPPEAERLAGLLERWGVPRDRIVVEGRSRNTRENAIETARVASEHELLSLVLVTSAFHMPRALGCFRAVGLTPDALPVDRQVSTGQWSGLRPNAEALAQNTRLLRELAGRAIYWVMGYTR